MSRWLNPRIQSFILYSCLVFLLLQALPDTFGGEPPTKEVTPNNSFSDNEFRLRFDERGEPVGPSQATLDEIVNRAPNTTDIFVFSHGWQNDPWTADDIYRKFKDGMILYFPRDQLKNKSFHPLFVGVYWPSAWFPVRNCTTAIFKEADVIRWAHEAFPAAASNRADAFSRELGVVLEALSQERRGATAPEYQRLPEIMNQWGASFADTTPGEHEAPGEPSIFKQPIAGMAQGFDQSVLSNDMLARAGLLRSVSPCSLLNTLSFWSMKKRAGNVGARGLYAALKQIISEIKTIPKPRIHLIGHSFGGKLLTAALTGPPGTSQSQQNEVQSLMLIQSAFSHFAFASADALRAFDIQSSSSGRYVDVIARRLVRGVIAATYSDQDMPNRVFYPIGAAVAHDYLAKPATPSSAVIEDCMSPTGETKVADGSERQFQRVVPKYGAIGANGIQATSVARCLSLASEQPLPDLQTAVGKALNIDASSIITGHSEIYYPQIYSLVWRVVLAGR
jgi:hypothetical protein